ncbi:High affinity sulfate transporter 1 [Hibiscus syriacus]|uniref:High affinity sulfate transporter 1 n=1 Tax=Hibiscus syriacus TaxID=106335 RepID=A0A6A3CQZ3_HIBSY|nr:High affinity sulfate transporter 1 [Hibiscus syriacus]
MSKRVPDEPGNMEMDVISVSSSRRGSENSTYVHKVGKPPKKTLLTEIGCIVKETFFSNDPLSNFKDQPRSRKFVLGLQAMFPILEWGRQYSLSKFKDDFIAGLTIASLCIPQDIGYAKLAYLPPQYGLYSSFVPPLIYAVMGSSRDIAIEPVAVVSLLLGTLLQNEIYRRLAFTATFFVGVTQATLGVFRLGFLIDFLSHAAIVGFMAGAAVELANYTNRTVLPCLHFGCQIHWKKEVFWVPAIAPMISIVLSTFFVYITRADKHGVQIVKHIRRGINPISVDEIFFSEEYLAKGFRIGVLSGMIALTQLEELAPMKDYQLDGNKEMVALGTMNIFGSMTSCYVATGGFHSTAVNYKAGCHTAVSNIVMSGVVLLTLELITPLFKYTANAILASIVISAVINLIDIEAMTLIWKIDKFDFVACMGAFFSVVFSSVELGLLIAVSISFAKILLQVTRPRTSVLGKLPRTTVYRNIHIYPDAAKVPGILIVRVDSAIYFSNSNYIKERILRWLMDEEERLKENSQPRIQYLVVEMSPVTDINTSGIHAMEELLRSLEKRDVKLVLASPGPVVVDKLHVSKFHEMIGEDKIFLTVEDAVKTCAPKMDLEP